MLNWDFSEKGLGIVFSPHFVHDFSRKIFLIYILITDQLSLPDDLAWLLFVLRDIDLYAYYNSLLTRLWRHNFEINLVFLIKSFFYMTKISRQKLKYLENEKSF